MGLFSFTQELAMDLGTANTIIISDGKIVVDEPSVVALDSHTNKMIAVGEKAKLMYEKAGSAIRVIRPLRDGVIADFNACEQMMRGLIKMVHKGNRLFAPPSLRMVIGVPSGSTEVELRAVRDSAEHANGRDVYLIYEPMAAAIGIGLDVEAPEGNMIVDIGGGTTEIAVISLGGIVESTSIKIAGDKFDEAIIKYVRRKHNILIGKRTAEELKIGIACLVPRAEVGIQEVKGRCLTTGLPKSVKISSVELVEAIAEPARDILETIHMVLERTPPELVADVAQNGIIMAGGGSLIYGFDQLVEKDTGIRTTVVDDALSCAAFGSGKMLMNLNDMQDGMVNLARKRQMKA